MRQRQNSAEERKEERAQRSKWNCHEIPIWDEAKQDVKRMHALFVSLDQVLLLDVVNAIEHQEQLQQQQQHHHHQQQQQQQPQQQQQ